MKYITRELETKFLEASKTFRAVMVSGARQVGKSTMLEHLAKNQGRTIVTLDNATDRHLAQSDPALFFQTYQPPLLIDEIQKAPDLLEPIKILCDQRKEPGLFWLTGSESKKLKKLAGDTLAGRLIVLNLFSLSQREKYGAINIKATDYSYTSFLERQKHFPANNVRAVFEHIWRGGMPEVQQVSERMLAEYFNSYIETYLMRDAVDDYEIRNTEGFRKVIRACASISAGMLDYTTLAQAGEVSVATAKEWVGILQKMGIVYLLEPYANNELKRLVKTPKLYFCDTGLCAHLSMWPNAEVLMSGAASGRYFENYVVMELVRSLAYGNSASNINYFRNRDMREIDIVLQEGRTLHAFEIKQSASPSIGDTKAFHLLEPTGLEQGNGGIICLCEKPFPLAETISLIPCNLI